MRVPLFLLVFLLIVDLAPGQTFTGRSATSQRSKTLSDRPALLGTGTNSLVNQIDTKDLIKKGQKDAVIMFSCMVETTGETGWTATYRGTPDSKLLEQEVLKRLDDAKLIPALHDHKPVTVLFYGTVVFAVVNDKPRLRIFANQETEELKKESDFISPQPYIGGDSRFTRLHYPETGSPSVVGGAVIALTVDASGNLKEINLVDEYPPLLKFGEAALTDFGNAKFIPAFRNGQPVESKVTMAVYYEPPK